MLIPMTRPNAGIFHKYATEFSIKIEQLFFDKKILGKYMFEQQP